MMKAHFCFSFQTASCMTAIAHLPKDNDENNSTGSGESTDSGESREWWECRQCESTDNGESDIDSSDEACILTSSADYQPECLQSPAELQLSSTSFQPVVSDSPLPPLNETQGEILHAPGSDDPLSIDPSEYPTFKIVGDNIAKSVKPRFRCYDSQSKSLHYFNHYAVKDCTDISHLSGIPTPLPSRDYLALAESLLPSSQDNETLANNSSTHFSRILTSNMSFF